MELKQTTSEDKNMKLSIKNIIDVYQQRFCGEILLYDVENSDSKESEKKVYEKNVKNVMSAGNRGNYTKKALESVFRTLVDNNKLDIIFYISTPTYNKIRLTLYGDMNLVITFKVGFKKTITKTDSWTQYTRYHINSLSIDEDNTDIVLLDNIDYDLKELAVLCKKKKAIKDNEDFIAYKKVKEKMDELTSLYGIDINDIITAEEVKTELYSFISNDEYLKESEISLVPSTVKLKELLESVEKNSNHV